MADQGLGLSVPDTMFGALLRKPPFIKPLWATKQMLPVLLPIRSLRNRPCFCSEGKLRPALGCLPRCPQQWPAEMIPFPLGRKEILQKVAASADLGPKNLDNLPFTDHPRRVEKEALFNGEPKRNSQKDSLCAFPSHARRLPPFVTLPLTAA